MPTLAVTALRDQARSKRLASVYLLFGEDVRLIEQLVDEIEGSIDPADRAFAVDRLYAAEAGGTPVDIVASARGMPMLGDRRIVIVLRAERFLKPKRASKATEAADDAEVDDTGGDGGPTDMTTLEEYLADPVASNVLVFVATEIDKTRRLTKRVLERAQVVECGGLASDGPGAKQDTRRAATEWVRGELVRIGRAIDPDALDLLIARAGFDITRLRGDVERLLLYTEGRARITRDDVDEVASTETNVDDEWAIVNAISDGDAGRALRELASRLDRGDSAHGIVGQLRWWVSTRLAEAEPGRVKAALDVLMRTDLDLKSSGGDARVLSERLVVELTGRPVPRRGWR